ncbi:MAG: type II secretion system F family protein, partial [Patescibacteria group bacterium]
MLYNYKASTPGGLLQEGSIDAPNIDFAIATIQRRGLIIIYVNPVKSKINIDVTQFFEHVKLKDVVILSRQMATLFEAKVAVLNIFRLLSTETENRLLRRKLIEITDDIQSGISISTAMTKHPEVFSKFYVSLV